MPATAERPARSTPATTTEPIFVDPTGRRLRRGQLIGGVVIALMATYVAVMLLAFLGGTTVDAPNLPPQDPARAAASGPDAGGGTGPGTGHVATTQQTHR